MLENNWSLQPQDIFKLSPIIPVMVINKIEHAVPWPRPWLPVAFGYWK